MKLILKGLLFLLVLGNTDYMSKCFNSLSPLKDGSADNMISRLNDYVVW